MGRKKKKQKAGSGGQVIRFGRIIQDPHRFNGRPTLRASGIDALNIIDLFRQGATNGEVFDSYPGELDWDDLTACKAWQARFMPETLSRTFNRVSDQNMVMLDENMAYFLLPCVTRLFGRSSHVYADGLVGRHKDDERNIWAHMIENDFKAIITADDDFRDISERYRQRMMSAYGPIAACPEPVPVVIEVQRGLSRTGVGELLKTWQEDILRFMEENDAAYATVDFEHGLVRHNPDPENPVPDPWIAKLKSWQTGRPAGPS